MNLNLKNLTNTVNIQVIGDVVSFILDNLKKNNMMIMDGYQAVMKYCNLRNTV